MNAEPEHLEETDAERSAVVRLVAAILKSEATQDGKVVALALAEIARQLSRIATAVENVSGPRRRRI